MNLKTTIFLILLTGAGIGVWVWWDRHQSAQTPAASATLDFLQNELTAGKLQRIEVSRLPSSLEPPQNAAGIVGMAGAGPGPGLFRATSLLAPHVPQTLVSLEKIGGEWHLPGNWPVRPQETEQYIAVLTNLHSRFAPEPLGDHPDLKPYGLDDKPLLLKITTGAETHTLEIGAEPDETHPFTRATFLRLDDKPEVIRLGPGVFAALNRSLDYFRQRRLFTIERVAKDEDAKEKVEQLDAVEVEVTSDAGKFAIQKQDKDWLLKEAYKKKDKDWLHVASNDRLDPATRDALLRAFPDLWAETFVAMKSLDDCGLKEPAYTITVTRPSGAKTTLLVGKIARSTSKITLTPGPMPMPQQLREEYRYAKLDKNEQIFEIKTDKLGDITVPVDSLRDPQLARFKTDDVKRLEIHHGNDTLVFAKVKEDENDKDNKKEKWRIEKPHRQDVEAKQVEEILDKLAGLQARDEAILGKADAKEVGLDKPAGTIKITVAEGKDDKKTTRAIVFTIGLKEGDKDKAYVKVDGWPRINQVGGEFWTLARRPELAYRPRELWKLERDDITRITIDAQGKSYHLDHDGKKWKIGGPIDAEATGPEPDQLAEGLAHLRCERFEARKGADLAKYGLDKPAFTITVNAKDNKTHTLEIGKRDDAGKESGRFAQLKGGDAIFVLSEKLTANFHTDPLELLDKNLTSFNPAEIDRIRYQGAANFSLEKKKGEWQVVDSPAAPFTVDKEAIENVLKPWQKLRAEKFAAVGPKIAWADFGLDKPATTVVVTLAGGAGEKTKDHVVEFGKEAKDGGRYARFDKKDAVVLLPEPTAEQLNRSYLDFVETRVLRPFDADAVVRIDRKMGGADLEIMRREDAWQILKPSVREGDLLTIFDLVRRISGLQAKRIAAYPAKDLKEFGLSEPSAIVTLTLDFDGAVKKHVIKVGAVTKAKGEKDERFALVDDKPMVIVLSAELSRHLTAAPLYFADRNLVSFSGADRAELSRGPRKLTFTRGDAGWQIVEPIKAEADSAGLDELLRGLQRLRADEIVADKTTDLKKYGLDPAAAQWRFKLGAEEQVNLLIGAAENTDPGARRYAKLGNRNSIFLLNGKTAARLLAEFRSKNVWPPFDAAKAEELAVTGPTGSFTLKKKDKEWTVVGQPKTMVKAHIVADTIEMLATLAAHHFVLDAKADLPAYGLEKPAWKLEVQTPTGKRELWLGAMEDKGKRPFATVPGSGGVFVIDEIDNIILARPLASYLVEEEKKK